MKEQVSAVVREKNTMASLVTELQSTVSVVDRERQGHDVPNPNEVCLVVLLLGCSLCKRVS